MSNLIPTQVVSGADGCKGGWVIISKDLSSGSISWHLAAGAHELFNSKPTSQVIALDIPIGLPNKGPRACDLEARRLLGPGRASSVFPAPIRSCLSATNYASACQVRLQIEAKSLSRQAWAIMRKIRDIDEFLRQNPTIQARVREVHPELCFYFLNGRRPLQHSKKKAAGREERRKLLEPVFGKAVEIALSERKTVASEQDDVLDAFAALWTAERIAKGDAQTIPSMPLSDSFGLRMEMVA